VFSTVTLRDGRVLEYVELGDAADPPVVLFHGTPSTAGQAVIIADAVPGAGVRLVAPTRPGYADSPSTPPGLASVAADMMELADHLGLDRFATMGLSGGGPFALAVAAAAPQRVASVAVHASPASFCEVMPDALEEDDHRALALLADGDVDGAVRLTTQAADAELAELRGLSGAEFAAAMQKRTPPGETWLDRRPAARAAFNDDFRRAITTSHGYVRDNLSWVGPWDIDLASVTAPVRMVYGESDSMVPHVHAEWLRQRLPSSELHVVPGGHGDATFGASADSFAAIAAATTP
jgi:pimeloyl-ACP methyl ester carboxylesterase